MNNAWLRFGGGEGLGSGFRVQGSGSRVQGSGFRVQGLGFRVSGFWFGLQGLQGLGNRDWGLGLLGGVGRQTQSE